MGRGEMPITLNKLVTKKGVTKIALAVYNNFIIDVTINKISYYKMSENKVTKFVDETDFGAYNGRKGRILLYTTCKSKKKIYIDYYEYNGTEKPVFQYEIRHLELTEGDWYTGGSTVIDYIGTKYTIKYDDSTREFYYTSSSGERLMSWKKGDLTPSNTNLIIAGVVCSIAVGVGGYFLYKHNLLQKLVKKLIKKEKY